MTGRIRFSGLVALTTAVTASAKLPVFWGNAQPSDRFLDPNVFDPNLASNLTWMIQSLIVLLVSTDVIALKILSSGRGISLTFKSRHRRGLKSSRCHRGEPAAPDTPGRSSISATNSPTGP